MCNAVSMSALLVCPHRTRFGLYPIAHSRERSPDDTFSPAARARKVRRLIFPELVSGNSSKNSTTRGYL